MGPDIIKCKMFKPPIAKTKRKERTNISKTPFLNEGVEVINLLCIFHDPSVKECLLIDIKFDYPTVVYSLNNPRSKY